MKLISKNQYLFIDKLDDYRLTDVTDDANSIAVCIAVQCTANSTASWAELKAVSVDYAPPKTPFSDKENELFKIVLADKKSRNSSGQGYLWSSAQSRYEYEVRKVIYNNPSSKDKLYLRTHQVLEERYKTISRANK